MKEQILKLYYLPSISYFIPLISCKKIIIPKETIYKKQHKYNRTYILSPNKENRIHRLTIPIKHAKKSKLLYDIEIDNSKKWAVSHWRSIETSYNKSPFFLYYRDDLYSTLMNSYRYLIDSTRNLLNLCTRWLGLTLEIEINHTLKDISFYSDKDISSSKWQNSQYKQVFGNDFISNLSIIDLIFCEGPNALDYIKRLRDCK